MSIVCFTGWQQSPDALSDIAPGAMHVDYAAQDNFLHAPKLAIGWSLGGQVLLRAAAAGWLKPEAIILLSVPFHFNAGENFLQLRQSYEQNPAKAVRYFNNLVAVGDANASRIARALNARIDVWKNGLFWLDELARTDCGELDFSGFPPTVIIHGRQDKIVAPSQAADFLRHIPHAQCELWDGCAHAPHLHDREALRTLVRKYV